MRRYTYCPKCYKRMTKGKKTQDAERVFTEYTCERHTPPITIVKVVQKHADHTGFLGRNPDLFSTQYENEIKGDRE